MNTSIPEQRPSEVLDSALQDSAVCIGCGCADMEPCITPEGPCHWLYRSGDGRLGVCSACDYALSVNRILNERHRQIVDELWSAERDDTYTDESLAMVAACYAAPTGIFRVKHGDPDADPIEATMVPAWPESWHKEWDKRGKHNRIHQLEIAGALIAAEIDRLTRLEQAGKEGPNGKY